MTEPRPHTESELVEFVRSIDVRAPEELHRKVESLIAARSRGARPRTPVRAFGGGRSRLGMGLAGATALAAVAAVAIAAGLTGGTSSGLSVRQTSTLTLRGATAPAPAERPGNRGQLAAAVDGISFPYWEERFGWRSTGARSDHLDGRTVTTVFYQDSARTAARLCDRRRHPGTPAERWCGRLARRRALQAAHRERRPGDRLAARRTPVRGVRTRG